MNKCTKNILVLEPSDIIYEGLYSSITKYENNYSFSRVENLIELEMILLKRTCLIVIINPSMIQNKIKLFSSLKNEFKNVKWVGLLYSFFDNSLLSLFDNQFQITEDVKNIIHIINKVCTDCHSQNNNNEHLTERETDVLKWLAKGLSNKEIATQLNVSIHTVNTHRKNIMDKTSIRSLAGLTIYAVTKGIISLD